MAEIIIDPLTRISGFLEIGAETDQNTIINSEVRGLLFRGFETMLSGRPPLDAVFFTERICGICSTAHAYASTLALEEAIKVEPSVNDKYLRDIIHGFEYIQNHLRHFYIMVFPDYVRVTSPPLVNSEKFTDYRLPEEINQRLNGHYAMSFEYARLAHEGQAVLAGKAPHNHGIFPGGVATDITAYKLEKVKSTAERLLSFVSSIMREDAETLAYYYPDYYEMGISYPNFMSYGAFDYGDSEISYVSPGILMDGVLYEFQRDLITEQVMYAWYQNTAPNNADPSKKDAYSFVKAARYNGMPMEVGPLARMLISGNYHGGHSCMDRIMARMLETEKILRIILALIERIKLLPNSQRELIIPDTAAGAGLIDTTRGALGHFVSVKGKVIEHYDIVTPSNWNLSPKDSNGTAGVIEKALTGTVIQDIQNPAEIGRIVRSFDPCVSCATHLLLPNGERRSIEVRV
jgi:hydrogenase large subunit